MRYTQLKASRRLADGRRVRFHHCKAFRRLVEVWKVHVNGLQRFRDCVFATAKRVTRL